MFPYFSRPGYNSLTMLTKGQTSSIVLGPLLFAATAVPAQSPVENVSSKRHPNLAAAQRLAHQAFERVVAAQQANEWDIEGHAQKAKELLD